MGLKEKAYNLLEESEKKNNLREPFFIHDQEVVLFLMNEGWELCQHSGAMNATWLRDPHAAVIANKPNVASGILKTFERRGFIGDERRDPDNIIVLVWKLTKLGKATIETFIERENMPLKSEEPAPLPNPPKIVEKPAPIENPETKPNALIHKERATPILGALYRAPNRTILLLEFEDAIELVKACAKLGINPQELDEGLPVSTEKPKTTSPSIHTLPPSIKEEIDYRFYPTTPKRECDYCKSTVISNTPNRLAYRYKCERLECRAAIQRDRKVFKQVYGRAAKAPDRQIDPPAHLTHLLTNPKG